MRLGDDDDPLVRLLGELTDAGVEFIVVGGAAAVLQNAPVVTEDVDIVHRRTDDNIARLSGVLDRLDAYFRGDLRTSRATATSCSRQSWASSIASARSPDNAATKSWWIIPFRLAMGR